MRTMRRVGVALLTALAFSTPVFAQSSDNRVSLNAAIGPSFANLGTTFPFGRSCRVPRSAA